MNISKISEVLQGQDESPRKYYKCLCQAFCLYTCFDLEATENQWMINATCWQGPEKHKVKIAETGGPQWNEH
jgi:hypothetical protein